MADSRPSPTGPEREQLRQFVRIVDSMRNRRFMVRWRQQNHRISSDMTGPDYDREDLEAFLTDFRKVAMSDSEPVYLTKVIGTVGKFGSDRMRACLKPFRSMVSRQLEGKVSIMFIGYQSDGQEITKSPEQILNALVNGEIFHVDLQHAKTAEELRKLEPLFYLWPTINFFIIPIFRSCMCLFNEIREDGILDLADYPARCRQNEG